MMYDNGKKEFFDIFILLWIGLVFMFFSKEGHTQEKVLTFRTGPFLCRSTVHTEQIDFAFQSVLSYYDQLYREFSVPQLHNEVDVYIFDSEEAWKNYFKTQNFGFSYRRSFFDRSEALLDKDHRPKIYLFLSDNFENDLRHECLHALFNGTLKKIPLWLDEGFAEYFEVADNRPFNDSWLSRAFVRIQNNRIKTLKQLESMTNAAAMKSNDYGDSWMWINFFINGPEHVQTVFKQYIVDLTQKKLFYTSLSSRLAKRRIDPQKELIRWYNALQSQNNRLTEK